MKMQTIPSSSLFNVISFALLIIGSRAAVLQNKVADNDDITSAGEMELTDNNLDRSQIGYTKRFTKSKRIIHETPESRLVLDDINENYANNDLIAQQGQTSNLKVSSDGSIKSTQMQSAQKELMQKTISTQTNKLSKETARSNLRMHDHTKDENQKINGVYADLIEEVSIKSNGEIETSMGKRQGDYASDESTKTNRFLLNYIPKTSTGNELYAEMATTTYGEGSYSNNESISKTNLKITPGEQSEINAQHGVEE